MAGTTAPLMGFGASGQIGKSMVHAHWKGRTYARKYVVPKNPKTTAQSLTRDIFAFLSAFWKNMDPAAQEPTQAYVKGKAMTDRNRFTSQNLAVMRSSTNMTTLRISEGANGGPPNSSETDAGGVGTVTITPVAPTPPTGWSLLRQDALVFLGTVDPHNLPPTPSKYGTDPTGPIAITGLPAGTYRGRSWPVWTKPDGTLAYGPDIITGGMVVT